MGGCCTKKKSARPNNRKLPDRMQRDKEKEEEEPKDCCSLAITMDGKTTKSPSNTAAAMAKSPSASSPTQPNNQTTNQNTINKSTLPEAQFRSHEDTNNNNNYTPNRTTTKTTAKTTTKTDTKSKEQPDNNNNDTNPGQSEANTKKRWDGNGEDGSMPFQVRQPQAAGQNGGDRDSLQHLPASLRAIKGDTHRHDWHMAQAHITPARNENKRSMGRAKTKMLPENDPDDTLYGIYGRCMPEVNCD